MSEDLPALVGQAWPYVAAALSAYGGAVLAKTQEDAAEATVGWGRRILQRIFGTKATEEELPKEIAELVATPEDIDLQGAVRARICQLLSADPQLAAEMAQLVRQAGQNAVGRGQITAQAYDHAQQANLGQGAMTVSFGAQHER